MNELLTKVSTTREKWKIAESALLLTESVLSSALDTRKSSAISAVLMLKLKVAARQEEVERAYEEYLAALKELQDLRHKHGELSGGPTRGSRRRDRGATG
jgi:hypothetical protein